MSVLPAIQRRYDLTDAPVLLNGMQAITRLLIDQAASDKAAGLKTAGFVSGYRGSPLGGLDMELKRAARFLDGANIRFQPGINEDIAATSVWGSQQANAFGGAKYDGVFGLWYGKGPGLDRSGDAIKHANAWGVSEHGGVLAVVGDDHGAKSSSLAHQSEGVLIDACIPVLHPASIAEIVEYGLYGYALSRFSGLWVALKLTASVADTAALAACHPQTFRRPEFPSRDGRYIRWPDSPIAQEERLFEVKLPAARAFVSANPIDATIWQTPRDKQAIVCVGKAYNDVRAALDLLKIRSDDAAGLGLRLIKVGIVWPLDSERLRPLLGGVERVLVVEEKKSLVESALKQALFGRDGPKEIVGKRDQEGAPLLPQSGELDAEIVARAIAGFLAPVQRFELPKSLAVRTPHLRTPYFCAGCPHNQSTKAPKGSIAIGGIGCHSMAMHMERDTIAYTQMGGEGASWIGQAPFSETAHVFQNIGDGTFFHSGSLGVRAAVAAGVNITFKILYNDAVAMTGGQAVDGPLSIGKVTQILRAEGVERIALVSDEVRRRAPPGTVDGVTLHHRDALDEVQQSLRETPGVSALIYDQVCAAENRRRRRRGLAPKPAQRVFINPDVCEGCGDCGIQSNCIAIQALATPRGTKRVIDQSACNVDASCLKGFCPSFVTVEGAAIERLRVRRIDTPLDRAAPPPIASSQCEQLPYRIVLAGVGGTGVVTLGAIIAAAALIDGRSASTYDMTGMAQKGGPVLSHVSIADRSHELHGGQIAPGSANLLIGCDLVVAASHEALRLLRPQSAAAVWNTHAAALGGFTRHSDAIAAPEPLAARIEGLLGADHCHAVAATELSEAVLNDTVGANLILLGAAWQQGLMPLSLEAIEEAINLNGVEIDANLAAFRLGRSAAYAKQEPASAEPLTYKSLMEANTDFLREYQDEPYSDRYLSVMTQLHQAEQSLRPGSERLSLIGARNLARLMAYKDEYEVARLHVSGDFLAALRKSGGRVRFHLAPPFMPGREAFAPNRPKKRTFGAWIIPLLAFLGQLRVLRGTRWDPFGWTRERRKERALIDEYIACLTRISAELDQFNYEAAIEWAQWPEPIKGYGPVKEIAIVRAEDDARRFEAAFTAAKNSSVS